MAKPRFLAGAAAVPISPLSEHLAGRLYLGGYDGYLGRPAQGVHDDLYARAFVLTHGDATLVLLILDLVGMTNFHIARIRRRAARHLGVPEGNILVACTQTHAGPDLQGLWGGVSREYASHLRGQAFQAIAQAAAGAREASLRVAGVRVAARTVNRRGWPQTDETMTVLQARDSRRKAIATVVNFAAHPTITREENRLISRDFPGILVDGLERDIGGVALFVNADQGDVNPNAGRDFQAARDYGEALAQDAATALKEASGIDSTLRVISHDMDVPLVNPYLRLPPAFAVAGFLAAVRRLAGLGVLRWLAGRYPRQERAFVFAGLGLLAEHPLFVRDGVPVVRTRASRVRIGDGLDALAAPGEVLTRLGIALRSRLQAPTTMLLGLTNDTLGYFVPEDEWMTGRNKNYEETVSLGPCAGPTLERAATDLLAS